MTAARDANADGFIRSFTEGYTSTERHAQRIVVMEGKRIVQMGTHEALVSALARTSVQVTQS